MKLGARLRYAYHTLMAAISNPIARLGSKVMRGAGGFSNKHEAAALDAEIDILKPDR